MTATPQPMIVGTRGGWALPIAFTDTFGNPLNLAQAGLTPVADFYQPNLRRTTSCAVLVTNAASGQALAIVPQDVVLSTVLPPPGNILIGAAPTSPATAPCHLHAYVIDSQGTATAHVIGVYQPIDPRTSDPSTIPAPSPLPVIAGPSGPAGGKGDQGLPGASGSSDPQPVTVAGTVAQHQVIYLDAAGALPASSDQPGQAGTVLGLALGAGTLGQQIQYTATGIVTDETWTWAHGPVYLGLGGGLTQSAPAHGFVQQVGVAFSPTSMRVGLSRPVAISLPDGFEAGATYQDLRDGGSVLRAAAIVPGTPLKLVATGPDGYLPAVLLAPNAVKTSRLAGGPQLASLPNGVFEDGLDGWEVSTSGTAEVEIDAAVSAVGRQSAYLRCPAAGDVATVASGLVPCGEGVPVYVAARALLRSGAVLAVLTALFYDRNGAAIGDPVQIGTPLPLGAAFAEVGGYVLPPANTRYGAPVIKAIGAAGAVGAINVDELMLHRQVGGPAAWQVRRAARPAIVALGGLMSAFLATLNDADAVDGNSEAGEGATPAPIGGILYAALSRYLQTLGVQDPDLTRRLVAVWGLATTILPSTVAP